MANAAFYGSSQNEVLSRIWKNDRYHDVELQASDGVIISATRCVLASGSDVFDKMFFGGFSESSQSRVKIEQFPGTVIQAVVDYIHTGESSILSVAKKNDGNEEMKVRLSSLIKVAGAANYFNISDLGRRAKIAVNEYIRGSPANALIVLTACFEEGTATLEELLVSSLSTLRSNIDCLNDDAAVAGLAHQVLGEILQDKKMPLFEDQLFEILQVWFDANPEDRKVIAAELSKHINLEKIDPNYLAMAVSSCGFISQQQLCDAFRKQALTAHERNGVSFRTQRASLYQSERSTGGTQGKRGSRVKRKSNRSTGGTQGKRGSRVKRKSNRLQNETDSESEMSITLFLFDSDDEM